ncbi:MAG: cellulase family glycosylhydrolase, partial [Acidimicrobiales bacterium]|nr:cellulase family glycosylhydrolase [Acidimicrobiales bacterium]
MRGASGRPAHGGALAAAARTRIRTRILLAVASAVAVALAGSGIGSATATAVTGSPLALHVAGNQLVDAAGHPVVLRGADTSGTEYACVQEHAIFDGDVEASPSSIAAMQSWGFNAARVQLNESCWLGIQGVPASVSGAAYQQAIESYVHSLESAGMYVIVDLHWSSTGGSRRARGQEPMPDERYAPAFWTSVATAFKSDPAVVFDLFNEPYPNGNTDSAAAWTCDLDGSAGGTCTGFRYPAAGLQQLLDAVRATGATNVVMAGGPQYAGVLDQWGTEAPVDPRHQLAASIHIYWKNRSHPDW